MRYSLDEIYNFSSDEESYYGDESRETLSSCSSPAASLNEYSFINPNEEDDNIPQLFLPKYEKIHELSVKKQEKSKVNDSIDPELKQLMSSLNLQSKLPSLSNQHLVLLTRPEVLDNTVNRTTQQLNSKNDQNEIRPKAGTKEALSAIQDCFSSKLGILEEENKKQISEVIYLKKKAEEERKRKEQYERERREEEERKRRESEAKIQRERAELLKRQEEELKRKKEEEEQAKNKLKAEQKAEQERQKIKEEERLKQDELKGKYVTNFDAIAKTFWSHKKKIAMIKKDIVEPVKIADPNLKSLLSKHKRKVNPKFGQLTNSLGQLGRIQTDISALIDDTRSNHLAYMWILNFIAKAVVHQAETEVRVKPESGLPLGRLALHLLAKYPELNDLLMARFVKKCPFVIGFTTGIDTEIGRQNMGWKRKSDDKWEEDTSYDERMGGIMTLYAIITRLSLPPQFINTIKHPLPISNSWKILARVCNTPVELLTNTHFIVLGSWWDACASYFLQAYGNQGQKLLQLIANDLTSQVSDRKYVGAARLRILFEEWQTSSIKSFPEMEN